MVRIVHRGPSLLRSIECAEYMEHSGRAQDHRANETSDGYACLSSPLHTAHTTACYDSIPCM